MIKIVNLNLKFTKEYNALFNINLEINDGEKVCLLGQSESGKTSLLRVIAGLEEEYTGEAYINDNEIKKIDYKYDTNLVYMPKHSVFFDNKSVFYNLEYAVKLRDSVSSPYEIEKKIEDKLIEYGLEQYKFSKVSVLSTFERYLLSIARASMRKLDILLIDNIFDLLSDEEIKILIEKIKLFYNDDTFICIYSSEKEDVAKLFKCKIVCINNGVITGEKL